MSPAAAITVDPKLTSRRSLEVLAGRHFLRLFDVNAASDPVNAPRFVPGAELQPPDVWPASTSARTMGLAPARSRLQDLLSAIEAHPSFPFASTSDDPAARTEAHTPDDDEKTLTAVESRLAELAECAAEEHIQASAASNADLWRFLATHPGARPPALYLLENGNYRAMWWNHRGEQLGLQFRGNGEIQYVIFARRDDAPGGVGRSSGRDGFRGIERLLDAFNLKRLISREG